MLAICSSLRQHLLKCQPQRVSKRRLAHMKHQSVASALGCVHYFIDRFPYASRHSISAPRGRCRACVRSSRSRICRYRCNGRPCRSWYRAPRSSRPACPIAWQRTKPASSATRSRSWWPTAAIWPRMRPRWSISSRCRRCRTASRRWRAAHRSPIGMHHQIWRPSSGSMSGMPRLLSRKPRISSANGCSSIAAALSSWSAAA